MRNDSVITNINKQAIDDLYAEETTKDSGSPSDNKEETKEKLVAPIS